jgi:class 3 adenylate cyclase/tetratricopeptide (TPR) repeat protein
LVFTDLVASTELLEELGDDRAEAVRRTHFRLLRDAVRSRGGQEVKNLGDGLMVVFDSAVDAIGCAVAMQQSVCRHNQRAGGVPLAVRIGVNVGEPIRDEDDYFGIPVVVAKRLCDQARGGQIVATGLVESLVGSRGGFEFRPVGDLALKGLSRATPAVEVGWEPLGAEPITLPAAIASGERTAFVGRRGDRERLVAEWERARAGEPHMVAIGGEPGIGKTRLVLELCRAAHADGATVLFGRSYEETLIPYQPFVESLGEYVAVCPPDELRLELGAQGGELARLLPGLPARAPGLPGPLAGDPDGERYRLFEAVASLLSEASATRPIVFVLDDLHWADKPTLLLLAHVLRATARSPVLVVGTYRETELTRGGPLAEMLADLRRARLVEDLSLGGLTRGEGVELLSSRAGDGAPAEFSLAVAEQTGGNPFFIEEIARHLIESGAVYRKDGLWEPGLTVAEMAIPAGINDVIGRRVARLEDAAGRVLTIAAALGREFGLDVLAAVGEIPEAELVESLERGLAARLIEEEPGAVGRYRFSHALIRQTLYQRLSATRRARLHRQIGEGLERLCGDQLELHLGELAYHFFEAAALGDPQKAIDYAHRAGRAAAAQLAHEEAVLQYRRAIELLSAHGGSDLRRCELLLDLGEAQWRAGDSDAAQEAFVDAADLGRTLDEPELFARAALGYGLGLGGAGFTVRSDPVLVTLLEDALDLLDREHGVLRVRVLSRLAVELYYTPSIDRRADLSREAVQMASRIADPGARLVALYSRHWSLLGPDLEIPERLAIADEMVGLAMQAGDREMAYRGHHIRLRTLLEIGEIGGADVEIDACQQLASELRQPFYVWQSRMFEPMRLLLRGEGEDGERLALEVASIGSHDRDDLAGQALAAQRSTREFGTHRTAEIIRRAEQIAEAQPWSPVWRAVAASAHAELGHEQQARAAFEHLSGAGFINVPRDGNWIITMIELARTCGLLADRERASALYDLLSPYPDRFGASGVGSVVFGETSTALGILAATKRRWDVAARHFDRGRALTASAGCRPWGVLGRREHARMLLGRDGPGDGPEAASLLNEALASARELGMSRMIEQLNAMQQKLTVSATPGLNGH